MKTTVDIPEDVLKESIRWTGAKSKREAVVSVMQEYNRKRRMAALVGYSGTFADAFPTNAEIEAVEAGRERGHFGEKRRRGATPRPK